MKNKLLKKIASLAGVFSIIGASVALFFTSSSENTVIVAGSTTVLPLMEALSRNYFAEEDGRRVNVAGGGSSAGIAQIKEGAVQLGDSSRAPSSEDVQSRWDNLATIPLGQDVIVILANIPNEQINDLENFRSDLSISLDELTQIYTGDITNWSDVQSVATSTGNAISGPINVIGRQTGSGLRDSFYDVLAVNSNSSDPTPENVAAEKGRIEGLLPHDAFSLGSNGQVEKTASATPLSIAYLSLAYFSNTPYAPNPTALEFITNTVGRNVYAIKVAPSNGSTNDQQYYRDHAVEPSLVNAARNILPEGFNNSTSTFNNSYSISNSDNNFSANFPALTVSPENKFEEMDTQNEYPFWHTLFTIYNTQGTKEQQTLDFLQWIFQPSVSGYGSIPYDGTTSFGDEMVNGRIPLIVQEGYVPPLFGLQQNTFLTTQNGGSPSPMGYFEENAETIFSGPDGALNFPTDVTNPNLDNITAGWNDFYEFITQSDIARGVDIQNTTQPINTTGVIPQWAPDVPESVLHTSSTNNQKNYSPFNLANFMKTTERGMYIEDRRKFI